MKEENVHKTGELEWLRRGVSKRKEQNFAHTTEEEEEIRDEN